MIFTKQHTSVVKIIAICIMFYHHLFSSFAYYLPEVVSEISFFPFTSDFVIAVGNFGRICITFFAFLSGYGLTFSLEKINGKLNINKYFRFMSSHVLSLLSQVWIVIILWVPYVLLSGKLNEIYGSTHILRNIIYDFMGISMIMQTPSMNGSWWYISVAMLIIVIIPLFYVIGNKVKIALVVFLSFMVMYPGRWIYFADFYLMFILAAMIGVIFTQYRLFDKIFNLNVFKNQLLSNFILVGILGIAMALRFMGLLPRIIAIIITIITCILVINMSSKKGKFFKLLTWLGGYSTLMYLNHSFFSTYFFARYIYLFDNFIIIFITLFLVTLVFSLLINKILKLIKYDKFIEKVIKKINE